MPTGLWEAKDNSSVSSYLGAAWFKKLFEVHINASDRAIGGMLVQKRTFDCFWESKVEWCWTKILDLWKGNDDNSALSWQIKSILIGIKARCQDLQCC